jgi:YYY domain-containing protein
MTLKSDPKIDLNYTDEETLVTKLEVPARVARRILALRPYQSVQQLEKVWGIDAETLQRILPLVRVGSENAAAAADTNESPETHPAAVRYAVRPVRRRIKPAAVAHQPQPDAVLAPEAAPKKVKWQFTLPAIKIPAIQINWQLNFILLAILLVGAFFRFNGVNWDDSHHLHPDERFITSVANQLKGVSSPGAYFDTATSTLNPLKFGSYTYGMLPLFLTRMVAEWVKMTDYDAITLVGRVMSGLFDLAALLMLYLLGEKLYNRRTGLLAAVLGAAAVFPIQLSHYFTVDSFSTVFVVACFYFALLAVPLKNTDEKIGWSSLVHFGIFGFLVGLAGACKVNTLPVFGVIVLAGLARLVLAWKKPEFGTLLKVILPGWALALLLTFLAFRVFQPYAFMGPDFWGISLNQHWVDVIKEVTNQVAGNSDWPPNDHWTNRPLLYALTNMVVWGLGVPLGLAGWLGWLWAGWRMWKGEWRSHLLPFLWVTGYFVWQNAQFWRYMRYFMPIYPFIILFAAWALLELYDRTRESRAALLSNGFHFPEQRLAWRGTWKGALSLLVMAVVLLGTYVYALAFLQIYTHPVTRVTASRWILQNIPGPLNLMVDSPQGSLSYPVSIPNQQVIGPGDKPNISIHITRNGTASKLTTTNIRQVGVSFYFNISKDEKGENIVSESRQAVADDDNSDRQLITFGDINLDPGQTYYFHYKISSSSQLSLADVKLRNDKDNDPFIPIDLNIQNQAPGNLEGTFPMKMSYALRINRLEINHFNQVFVPKETTLQVNLFKEGDDQVPLATASQKLNFSKPGIQLAPTFPFPAVELIAGKDYQVRYEVTSGGPIHMMGDAYTMETSWDDSLPLSVDKYDALGGIYNPLSLELYEPDTPEKRDAMIQVLSQSNYIVISSNRAYDSMPRLPLRYPMTLKYYQELFGCNCSGDAMEERGYALEAPFKSPLGFDLVATFENPPSLGPLVFPDQIADESFTVYDHPKVLIFKKSKDFSIDHVKTVLNSVDLNQVIFQTPLSYTQAPNALELSSQQLAIQTNGGTWSDMFNRQALLNTNQTLGTAAWYLLLLLLGWVVFPVLHRVFAGLPDRGYPLARLAGLLILAWLAWILGSLNLLPFTQLTIALCALLMLAINLFLAYRQRSALMAYARAQWLHILVTEAIFLAVFLFSLNVRLGNPDLWHPWLGGEKPMDFAYFNSVLKAVYFPPENAWFSGHILNYYYYGYVIAAIPTKLLGIVPSIAYNLILPAWFAMTGIGVFCVAFNLVAGLRKDADKTSDNGEAPVLRKSAWRRGLPYIAGGIALVAVLLLGNLYQVRQFWQFLPEAANFSGDINNFNDHAGAALAGAVRVLTGQTPLPGNNGRWYFDPSRPILHNGPDTPIAEFPYFTFLYGDLHAHLLTMPFYALALSWMLAILLKPFSQMKWPERVVSVGLAAIFIGFLRAAHTWDFPTFVGLAVLTILWSVWHSRSGTLRQAVQEMAAYGLAFLVAVLLFYLPFTQNFHTEYVSLELWTGARTPLFDYLFVFGLALFIMFTLLIRDLWADFKGFLKYWVDTAGQNGLISRSHVKGYAILFACIAAIILLWVTSYEVLAFGLPLLAALIYLIFFKANLSFLRRIVWILFAIGLGLTWIVEVVVLKGDVGRSNTLFRFYMEAWFILGIALSVALAELIAELPTWPRQARWGWLPLLGLLVLCAASYPLTATNEKMTDRWPNVANPPHNLDGAAFILGDSTDPSGQSPAIYNDDTHNINISQDAPAIQFMQDHVAGSPMIVEGNTSEYRWGSRFSIYTGLPSVVGWSWHVRQHNSLLDGALIDKRIDDIKKFYGTEDIQAARQFIIRYQVKYIVVGGLERTYYDAKGFNKFQEMVNQGFLKMVFGDNTMNTTTVFEVVNAGK